MKLDDNYKKIKVFITNKGRECSNREEILDRHYKNAQKDNLDNFSKYAINAFADWGYKFEDFDFGNDNELKSYVKSQRKKYYTTRIVLAIIACIVGFFFLGGGKLIATINADKDKPSENEINCSSKLIKYTWTEKDGCQKANFGSKSDCLWATFGKTYYYNQETYSYNKYYEYVYDSDLYGYNKSGVHRYKTSNIPTDRGEYYITCSNDGSWHTNTFKNITEPVDYWESVKKDLF